MSFQFGKNCPISDVYVDYAKITESDIFASNGFIHAIDDVLIPESVRHDDHE